MDRITAITSHKRDPSRAIVRAGGRIVATVPWQKIHEMELEVDQPWDTAIAERVREADRYDRGLQEAMRWLNRRVYSCARLGEKLRERGYAVAMVELVIDELRRVGALDDEALGRTLIDEIQRRKPAGPRLLRAKLLQRRIEPVIVERLIDEAGEQTDAVSEAIELINQQLVQAKNIDPVKRRRRMWGVLARRGFDSDTIEAAFSQVRTLTDH